MARAWLPFVIVCSVLGLFGCANGGPSGFGSQDSADAANGMEGSVLPSPEDDAAVDADATLPPPMLTPEAGATTDGAAGVFAISPSTLQTIQVVAGQTMPGVPFTATLGGVPVAAAWTLDRGDVGTIAMGPAPSAQFAPTGAVGGIVTIIAGLNGQTLKCPVFVQLTATQNGVNPSAPSEQGQVAGSTGQLSQGGGVGGVGGEGIGLPVSDPSTKNGLANPGSTDAGTQGLAFLYPYDKTVWPRGMLAPLLMWTWAPGDADAIAIHLSTTSGSFTWTGTFAPPAVLAGKPFLRHPIPQDVWDMATNTAGGKTPGGVADDLTVTLTVAKNGVGYGPINQTWKVAPARLSGTVYYNSYGTQYVKNWKQKDSAGNTVGA
ncbi:MAG TPA: hypothetical protein VGI39_12030, partial [Polyangiaceae bacterium]